MMKRGLLTVFSLLLLFLAACSEPDTQTTLPLADQPASTWQNYDGAEGTVCANGAPYSHYAYKGSVNKLVIDFQGGGACWDGGTCALGSSAAGNDALYTDTVAFREQETGIYNHMNDANPVQDWYHVFIPYCTGDIHIGDAEREYTVPDSDTTYTVQHKGAVNARSVLDWTFENFEDPEQVFITGCSAGGYGAAYWTETIAAEYPGVDIKQLGDCAAGVATDAFSGVLEESWDANASFPDITFNKDAVNQAYTEAMQTYPNLKMAQYHSIFDRTQIDFYALGSGKTQDPNVGLEWSNIMTDSLANIDEQAPNFASYVSAQDRNDTLVDGTQHCIIVWDDFYTVETQGVKLVDWLTDYLADEEVENVVVQLPAPTP